MATQGKPSPSHLMPAWKPGQSGNPAGKPLGAKNKLAQSFIHALAEDFTKHGASVIASVRVTDPSTYLRVVASLMPREMTLEDGAEMTNITVSFVRVTDASRVP